MMARWSWGDKRCRKCCLLPLAGWRLQQEQRDWLNPESQSSLIRLLLWQLLDKAVVCEQKGIWWWIRGSITLDWLLKTSERRLFCTRHFPKKQVFIYIVFVPVCFRWLFESACAFVSSPSPRWSCPWRKIEQCCPQSRSLRRRWRPSGPQGCSACWVTQKDHQRDSSDLLWSFSDPLKWLTSQQMINVVIMTTWSCWSVLKCNKKGNFLLTGTHLKCWKCSGITQRSPKGSERSSKTDSFDGKIKKGGGWVEVLSYPYRGPSLPIAETMITLLAVSSHTCQSNKASLD